MDVVLLGRKICEQSPGFGKWPYEGKRCWLFSRQQLEALPPLVAVTMDRPREAVREMERARLRRAWLAGGGGLAGAFHTEGLIFALRARQTNRP